MEGVWTCERHLTGAANEAFAASPEYCYFCTLEERDRLRDEGWPRSPEIHALNRRLWKLGRVRWEAENAKAGRTDARGRRTYEDGQYATPVDNGDEAA